MKKGLIVAALVFSIIFSSYASLTQSAAGIFALHEKLESPESKNYRQLMSGMSTEELISCAPGPIQDEDENDQESAYDSLSETFSSFDEVASKIVPPHPHEETVFFESYVYYFASRCHFWETKLTAEHEVTQLCYRRVGELNQFLSLTGRFAANFKGDDPLAPKTCSAIQSFARAARFKIDQAFLRQSKRLDRHFPFVRIEALKALQALESECPRVVKQFSTLESALDSIDLDFRGHCKWPPSFDDVSDAFYKFIFLIIF